MRNNGNSLKVLLTLVIVILAACGNSSEESSATLDNQSQNNNLTQNTNNDSTENTAKADNNDTDTINKDNNDSKENVDTSNNVIVKEEKPPTNNTEGSLQEEYLKKINYTKKEAEELVATDSSTYALKKVENDRWDIWDELLNEIYGVLKEQLSDKEMDQLREEQRNWIKYRDDCALEASLKYKGGTQEHLEYVAVLANLTEERCYELVSNYMK